MSVVERFTKKSEVIHRSKRLSEKTGKLDEESIWAKARLSQASQLFMVYNQMIFLTCTLMEFYSQMKIIKK